MEKTTLVIMAAGMGSRFGGGIKQLEHVGPSGEIIMDYSIFDAREAGFSKVVFIIRKDLEQAFREVIGNRIEKEIETAYVYQELEDLPTGFRVPEGRTKPWGTGQAVLCCKDTVKEPFLVINADDYYGKEAFTQIQGFLANAAKMQTAHAYCMAGFVLGNTLSENGIVTRGICNVDNGTLLHVAEAYALERKGDKAVGKDGEGNEREYPLNTSVSMNMWGFTPDFFDELQTGFAKFLSSLSGNEGKAEYLLPDIVGRVVTEGRATVQVLPTQDKWFGVTYKEDKEAVVNALSELVAQGRYPRSLFGV